MFKRICLKVNAENPQLPLMPSEPFEGSAATFEISGVPRAFAKRRIAGVTVNVTNVDGQTAAVACVFEGGAWSCTVPSAAIGASGFVGNGVIIAASGTDETGAAVPCWILGAGDLKVRRQDGTIEPGATLQTLHWFDERPESPKAGDVAPSPDDQSVLEFFDGETWRGFGGGASIEFDSEPTEGSQNAARSGGIWSWVKGLLPSWLTPSREEPPTREQVAAKADNSEVKLVPVYSDWIFSDGKPHHLKLEYIEAEPPYWAYLIDSKLADEHQMFDSKEDAEVALSLEFHHHSGDEPIDTTATRSVVAYKLGEQAPQLFPKLAVIDPASATTTGNAADALKVKEALAEKRGITDLKNYPETEQVLAERLPVVFNGQTFSNIRVMTDGPFLHDGSKYRVCGDVPEYQDITVAELDAKGRYVDGPGATFGGVVPTVGMQIACGGETGVSDGDTIALASEIPAPYTPPPYLRVYDEVRQCWWLGKMVNGVINWEVE